MRVVAFAEYLSLLEFAGHCDWPERTSGIFRQADLPIVGTVAGGGLEEIGVSAGHGWKGVVRVVNAFQCNKGGGSKTVPGVGKWEVFLQKTTAARAGRRSQPCNFLTFLFHPQQPGVAIRGAGFQRLPLKPREKVGLSGPGWPAISAGGPHEG